GVAWGVRAVRGGRGRGGGVGGGGGGGVPGGVAVGNCRGAFRGGLAAGGLAVGLACRICPSPHQLWNAIMPAPASDVAFTPSVKAVQEKRGSRAHFAKMEATGGWRTAITSDPAAFLAEARSFYLATASADGQPYVQQRGGPPG